MEAVNMKAPSMKAIRTFWSFFKQINWVPKLISRKLLRKIKLQLSLVHRRLGLCRVRHNEYVIWCWVGLFHGCIWICPSIYLLMGLHSGVEALTNGHHLSVIRTIRCRSFCERMRSSEHCRKDGCTSCYWWVYNFYSIFSKLIFFSFQFAYCLLTVTALIWEWLCRTSLHQRRWLLCWLSFAVVHGSCSKVSKLLF